jgi:hypothetical protein
MVGKTVVGMAASTAVQTAEHWVDEKVVLLVALWVAELAVPLVAEKVASMVAC